MLVTVVAAAAAVWTFWPRPAAILVGSKSFTESVVLLRGGNVVQQGAPAELFDSPAEEFVPRFVTAQRREISDDP